MNNKKALKKWAELNTLTQKAWNNVAKQKKISGIDLFLKEMKKENNRVEKKIKRDPARTVTTFAEFRRGYLATALHATNVLIQYEDTDEDTDEDED